MAVKKLILLVLLGLMHVNSQEQCDELDEQGFCGENCDQADLCHAGNCSRNLCYELIESDAFGFEYCTCTTGCTANASEDSASGRCNCVMGFIAPGCVDQCSGACSVPEFPDTFEKLCEDINRCSCIHGCDAEDYFDVNEDNVVPPREYVELNIFDPGFPEYDTCKCHCLNGMTGLGCDIPMNDCHVRCHPDGGCQLDPTSLTLCGSCNLHAHRNSLNECQCDPGWGNPSAVTDAENDCQTYIGACVPRCVVCFGPDADQCNTCVTNAEFGVDLFDGLVNFCECMEGWRGIDCSVYIGICIDRCGSCSDGIGCDQCIQNAEWDPFTLTCACSHGYSGDRCEHFTGSCDDHCCAVCYDDTRCRSCISNATLDVHGRCHCDPYWIGTACSQYVGSCHHHCSSSGSCSGPNANNCEFATANASFNISGTVVCDPGWGGSHCDNYIEVCDSRCAQCYGPYAYNCNWCVDNGVLDPNGYCACQAFWTGTHCEIYIGICHSRCNGCTGPTDSDCLSCVTHATKDLTGRCTCENYWTGSECSVATEYVGPCSSVCAYGCRGATAHDCITCVDNASKDIWGACVCNLFFTGEDCSIQQDYRGNCDQKCQGCVGPLATDCISCVPHATRNEFDKCICDSYWTGNDCSVSTHIEGMCHPICIGCTGPFATDCLECTSNSAADEFGNCKCNNYWAGEDCSIFLGVCADICNGCVGSTAAHCTSCIHNAEWNDFGFCGCNKNWTGELCTVYIGECHSMCDPNLICFGSGANQCVTCRHNASIDVFGNCSCNDFWGGSQCAVYTGICHDVCTGCHGPSISECNQCKPHASWDTHGRCVCDPNWANDDCSVYIGACATQCVGCHGPTAHDCDSCSTNAHWVDGSCQCKTYWTGDYCENYSGPCNERCHKCFGPTSKECITCIAHAYWDARSSCICEHEWTGENCATYSGLCDSHCADTCSGPTAADCDTCIANGYRNDLGHCRCQPGWGSHDCTTYSGQCHSSCLSCLGPSKTDCIACIPNSTADADNVCVCDDDYFGPTCRNFNAACAPVCNLCTGPTSAHCVLCVPGALRNDSGECECITGVWTGDSCSEIDITVCDHRCNGCHGLGNLNCTLCVTNAHRDEDGGCQCSSAWSGSSCTTWAGECSTRCRKCLGPTAADCLECIGNTVSATDCTCATSYGGDLCLDWIGSCASTCTTCFGPDAEDCYGCVPNASRSETGACTCHTEWSSATDCSVYDGECHNLCNGCIGPTEGHCIECIRNAHRDDDGWCQCDSNYSDGLYCTNYNGQCHSTCRGCTGPQALDCVTCVVNSTQQADGSCLCDANWGDFDCSEWMGVCDSHCIGCHGDTAAHCVKCVDNATRDVDGNCTCLEGWDEPDCSHYTGTCHILCDVDAGCAKGPLRCALCITNAYRDHESGFCVCASNWMGTTCELWSGKCDSRCTACTGPYNTDCLNTCVTNATDAADGSGCLCNENWGGDDCSIWSGSCHENCRGCHGGDTIDHCIMCVANAERNELGQCTCQAGWATPSCTTFEGTCSSLCEPTAVPVCYGHFADDCTSCIANAHRDSFGSCNCDEFWHSSSTTSCSVYSGKCHVSCETCSGPAKDQCITCRGEANIDVGVCSCKENYGGSWCNLYMGPCDDICEGCYGFGITQCVRCVENAHRVNGECVCVDNWSGTDCKTSGYVCDDSCYTCTGPLPDACVLCYNGFVNSFGTCMQCDASCATCDGTGTIDCLTCHNGTYLADEGDCRFCDINCLSCLGETADDCTSCQPDSSLTLLTSTSGNCICYAGLSRHPTTLRCVERCPNGFEMTSSSECALIQGLQPYELMPIYYQFTDVFSFADCTHPPSWDPQRGAYFNGVSSSIRLTDLELFTDFTIEMWIRVLNDDATIFSFLDIPLYDASYFHTSNSNRWPTETGNVLDILGCTDKGVNIGSDVIYNKTDRQSESTPYDMNWTHFAVSVSSDKILNQTIIDLFVNNINVIPNDVFASVVDGIIFENYNLDLYLGSTLNRFAYMHGFMYNFGYSVGNVGDFSDRFGTCGVGCAVCPVSGCLSNCATGQFVDANYTCCDCHSSCVTGCSDQSECRDQCHPNCKTCHGSGATQCTSCWEGGYLANVDSVTGSECHCASDYLGDPDNCRERCNDPNCEVCMTEGAFQECLKCVFSFKLDETTGQCTVCETEEGCYQSIKVYSYSEQDCGLQRYWDEELACCQPCPNDCLSCSAANVCETCNPGYQFAAGSSVCLDYCATGFLALGTGVACIGSDERIIDIVFAQKMQHQGAWEIEESTQFDEYCFNWQVEIYGGDKMLDSAEKTDPFLTEDRGLWFDGKLQYLTVRGFTMHHSSTLDFWIKPHGYGTVFSAARVDDEGCDLGYELAIQGGKAKFSDKTNEYHVESEGNLNFYEWIHLALTLDWNNSSATTDVNMFMNNESIAYAAISTMVLDVPDGTARHILGAGERYSEICDNYRGFMWSFTAHNFPLTSFSQSVSTTCYGCTACPPSTDCLGDCNWNQYYDGEKCKRCPIWCYDGCKSNGKC